MKPHEIKGMAKNILSDGKTPMPPDNDADDLGQASDVHVKRAGNGFIVRSTHPASPKFRQTDGPEGPEGTSPADATAEHVFMEHEPMIAHVHKITRTSHK